MISAGETIFALATVPGRAAVAVVRISGPEACRAAEVLGISVPPARRLSRRDLRDGDRRLDRALVGFFPGPESYTGEDVLELHLHGGRAVRDGVLDVLSGTQGLRFACPGEFTRRAVLNGRLDLTAAEAVGDLVNAETEAQREQALQQLDGGLSAQCHSWMERLTLTRAHLEAYIDFPDEPVPATVMDGIRETLEGFVREMRTVLNDGRRGERLREGLRVAVLGPPNAGKSSFVNWLSARDVAIVTEHPGTTRDVIEVHLDLGGFPVIVADTAGLRPAGDAIEALGMERARAWADQADLRILLLDASRTGIPSEAEGPFDLVLHNKTDLLEPGQQPDGQGLSVLRGDGLDAVLQELMRLTEERLRSRSGPVLTRTRHRSALVGSVAAIGAAMTALMEGDGPEIVAEGLRTASHELGTVTGLIGVEDLLDVIFRDFCIGK